MAQKSSNFLLVVNIELFRAGHVIQSFFANFLKLQGQYGAQKSSNFLLDVKIQLFRSGTVIEFFAAGVSRVN